MRCLTVRQPWAGLIVCGLKTIEFRSWRTPHRGTLLIHAAIQPCNVSIEDLDIKDTPSNELLSITGKIIGQVKLVDCRCAGKNDETAALCMAEPGSFAWILEDARLLAVPIPLKGKLGVYHVGELPTPG